MRDIETNKLTLKLAPAKNDDIREPQHLGAQNSSHTELDSSHTELDSSRADCSYSSTGYDSSSASATCSDSVLSETVPHLEADTIEKANNSDNSSKADGSVPLANSTQLSISQQDKKKRVHRALQAINGPMVVLDPHGPRSYSVFTYNEDELQVTINAVRSEDYEQYVIWRAEQYEWGVRAKRRKSMSDMPGREVFNETIKVGGAYNTIEEMRIDLSPALNRYNKGQAIITVRNVRRWPEEEDLVIAWVQVTEIGLSVYADPQALTVRATALATGQPLTDVSVNGMKVDAHGIVQIERDDLPKMIVAKCNGDVAFLTDLESLAVKPKSDRVSWHVFSDRGIYSPLETVSIKGWLREINATSIGDVIPITDIFSSAQWTVTDSNGSTFGEGICLINAYGGFDFEIGIPDDVAPGTATIEIEPILNDDCFEFNGEQRQNVVSETTFEIQEFLPPEVEVQIVAEQKCIFLGEECQVSAFFQRQNGEAVAKTKSIWKVKATESNYTPPGHHDFTFGLWQPWWDSYWYPHIQNTASAGLDIETNTDGIATLNLLTASDNIGRLAPLPPMVIEAQALIRTQNNIVDEGHTDDEDDKAWSAQTDILLHPSTLYVGLKSAQLFVDKGDPIEIEFIVTDIQGQAQSDISVKLRAARIFNDYKNARYSEIEDDIQEDTLISGAEPRKIPIIPRQSGRYRIEAEVCDSQGRRNRTEIVVWVTGATQNESYRLRSKDVELVPSKRQYKVGETAEFLVIAPFAPAYGIYTINCGGIICTEHFALTDTAHTIEVPITAEHIPNLHIRVDLLGQQSSLNRDGDIDTNLPLRSVYASGQLNVSVPPGERTLAVQILPRETTVCPDDEVDIDITLTDSEGRAVTDSEVTVVAIDETVLAVLDYKIPNPIDTFYPERECSFASCDIRSLIQLADLKDVYAEPKYPKKRTAFNDGYGHYTKEYYENDEQIFDANKALARIRRALRGINTHLIVKPDGAKWQDPYERPADINPQVLWIAATQPDSDGHIHVPFKIPNNLTRYRLIAIAADKENKFGYGESSLAVRLPEVLPPALPRFFNFGDKMDLVVKAHNPTDRPCNLYIRILAHDVSILDLILKENPLQAHERREFRFPIQAQKDGSASIYMVFACGTFKETHHVYIPIREPFNCQTIEICEELDVFSTEIPMTIPDAVWPKFGFLQFGISALPDQLFTTAFMYLYDYPRNYTEPIASRTIVFWYLENVLKYAQHRAKKLADNVWKILSADYVLLAKRLKTDGGFQMWDESDWANPFISLHACRALVYTIRSCGLTDIISDLYKASISYVKKIASSESIDNYSPNSRRFLQAYALEILREDGQPDINKVFDIIAEGGLETLPLDALGLLLPTLSEAAHQGKLLANSQVYAVLNLLGRKIKEVCDAELFTTAGDEDSLLLRSICRTEAILLRGLIIADPQNDLIPKMASDLLKRRHNGAWNSPLENAFALLALNDYFNIRKFATSSMLVEYEIGDKRKWDGTFTSLPSYYPRPLDNQPSSKDSSYSSSTIGTETRLEMYQLADCSNLDICIKKYGSASLYYHAILRYALKDMHLEEQECGFSLASYYVGLDDPDDVKGYDGAWHIKLGSRVICKTFFCPYKDYHFFSLVHPLPAGLEAIGPWPDGIQALITSGKREIVQVDAHTLRASFGTRICAWQDHIKTYDDRVEFYVQDLPGGLYTAAFIARATTPGTFAVPPTKAEEMHNPAVFGLSSSMTVIIE